MREGVLPVPEPATASGFSQRIVFVLERYPLLSETFVRGEIAAMAGLGHRVSIEATARPQGEDAAASEPLAGVPLRYREDDHGAARVAALGWLLLRHPLASLRDVLAQRRWRRQEWPSSLSALAPVIRRLHRERDVHLHVHFAAAAALDAQRMAGFLGVTHSLTAHAYDIFSRPRNLPEKLERAGLATSGCRYNVEHLRRLVSPEAAARVHEVVMGVDGERFRRRAPLPGGRSVIAVGRLVEKKGFTHLIRAAALLHDRHALQRVVIVGEGPERPALERLIGELGVGDLVSLAGALQPAEVRNALEQADLLAMPSVVAADGDRDSMPVVVKEALAMEVMVIASDEVGLPEIVAPEFGRLVAPGDPGALAQAIEDLLAAPLDVRARMGAAGRAWVLEHASVDREARRLADLIAAARVRQIRP